MEIKKLLYLTKIASRKLKLVDTQTINNILIDVAKAAISSSELILHSNSIDLLKMDKSDPKYDRLMLSLDRIKNIADDILNVAALTSPLGKILSDDERPNGMKIQKISEPFGVIGIIYEARPNVTFDVFALCLKSGNACVLKGGSDAENSNSSIAKVIKTVLTNYGIDENTITLLPSGREATEELLKAHGLVELIIPRGSQSLINFVRENSRIPVIETGAGICHTYFDEFGDLEKGKEIINNAKTRRPSVCNALDCLIINEKRLNDLPQLCSLLQENKVSIYADEKSFEALSERYPASLLSRVNSESYGTEFLSLKMSVKTVANLNEAIEHIEIYSSKHSEAIITEDTDNQTKFKKAIDAAAVYCNVSTAFTDGAQFGLGAEIGISTQKLHARGPMALQELTSYKWIITGEGQIRPK